MADVSPEPRDPEQIRGELQLVQKHFDNLMFQNCPTELIDRRVAELGRRFSQAMELFTELSWAKVGKVPPNNS